MGLQPWGQSCGWHREERACYPFHSRTDIGPTQDAAGAVLQQAKLSTPRKTCCGDRSKPSPAICLVFSTVAHTVTSVSGRPQAPWTSGGQVREVVLACN